MPEDFWSIKLSLKKDSNGLGTSKENTCDFTWKRARLFDQDTVEMLKECCEDAKVAKVVSVVKKQTKKFRPQPLNTIEATKLISRKLRISPDQTMSIMEKLYQRGYLSYPRTETNVYNKTINLRELIDKLGGSD